MNKTAIKEIMNETIEDLRDFFDLNDDFKNTVMRVQKHEEAFTLFLIYDTHVIKTVKLYFCYDFIDHCFKINSIN